MALVRNRQSRSRLNLLVELFEKGAKTDASGSSSSTRPGRLSTTMLQPLTAASTQPIEEDANEESKPVTSSVNKLITSFESRKQALESRVKTSKKSTTINSLPEVERLVNEVFEEITESFGIDNDAQECCFLDLMEGGLRTDLSDEVCSPSVESSTSSDSNTEQISALWTQEAIATKNPNPIEDLSLLLEQYEDQETNSNDDPESIQETVDKIFTSFQQTETFPRSVDTSVRSYKALIEMTVLKEAIFKPTVSTVNRVPCLPVAEDLELDVNAV